MCNLELLYFAVEILYVSSLCFNVFFLVMLCRLQKRPKAVQLMLLPVLMIMFQTVLHK